MPEPKLRTISVSELRVGLYVHLGLDWLDHPFARSHFKITSEKQIATIRGLGLQEVECAPELSDPPASEAEHALPATVTGQGAAPDAESVTMAPQQPAAAIRAQQHDADSASCEQQYQRSIRSYKAMLEQLSVAPEQAGAACARLSQDMVAQLQGHEEAALSLLTEGYGDRFTQHAINVTVLSLLLGRALGLDAATLEQLGVAALAHDTGKLELPEQVRYRDESFTTAHFKLYQEHVRHSVNQGQQMGLESTALLAIAQHHELANGKGFPLGLQAEQIAPAARILALVNRYDGLCNPANHMKAMTPHAALSLIYAIMKERFDRLTLSAFVRMLGVYPPGSLVQLTDERYALVTSVNASRPLKPRVLVTKQPGSKEGTVTLDLQLTAGLGIQRSLRPDQLPQPDLVSLCRRQRICYYFERAVCLPGSEAQSG